VRFVEDDFPYPIEVRVINLERMLVLMRK